MNTAIAIITYKNRYKDILNMLDTFSEQYDVYVCLQDNDDMLSSYDVYKERYKNIPNIKFVVFANTHTIAAKRQKTLDYIYDKGYEWLIEIDDDLYPYGSKITPESKRATSKSYKKIRISLLELFDKMLATAIDNDAAFVSPKIPYSLGFSKPGVLHINKSINFGQCIALNVKRIKAANIAYTTSNDIHEDVDLVFQIMQHGFNCVTLGDYSFEVKQNSKENSVIGDTNHYNLRYINLYLKYKDGISLVVRKNDEIRSIIRLNKYFNTFVLPEIDDDYHKRLYELCQSYDTKAIIEHIKNNKTHGK